MISAERLWGVLVVSLLFAPLGESLAQQRQQVADNLGDLVASADKDLDRAVTYPRAAANLVDDVLERLERAVVSYPNSASLQMIIGRAYLVRDCAGRSRDCSLRGKAHLTRALELDPKLVRAHVLLAHDALESGCGSCAEPHVVDAGHLAPSDPYVIEVRARMAARLQKLADSERLYRKAIESFASIGKLCPTSSLTRLSEVYKGLDDYDSAEKVLKKAADCAPDGAWSVGNLGTFYIFAKGDHQSAIPVLRRALSIANYGAARLGLGLALYERWADLCSSNSKEPKCVTLWQEANDEYSDSHAMFFVSAEYAGTGRATRALLETGKVPRELIEQRWSAGRTPLQLAVDNDNTELAIYLLGAGANPNLVNSSGYSLVHVAGRHGNFKVLQALERAKANLNALSREENATVLMFVAGAGKAHRDRLAAAQYLIDRGMPVNARSATGWNVLSGAIGAGDAPMVKLLLDNGADPNAPLVDDLTPATMAITGNHPEVLRELVARNAIVPATIHGTPAAEYAEKSGMREIAKILTNRRQ